MLEKRRNLRSNQIKIESIEKLVREENFSFVLTRKYIYAHE